jgi:diadenosine tetraphosphate (Ap4A) HIT family hydrolase
LLGLLPFCTLDHARIVAETEHALALRDAYPIAPGHMLVIPRLHMASLFDLSPEVQAAVRQMVAAVRAGLAQAYHTDGFTIGVNDGVAAGPRFTDDVPDPRGGIRWVKPDKAAYWNKP